jgi:hypothetical protein
LRFKKRHQWLVDNIELLPDTVKIKLKAINYIELVLIVGKEAFVIQPHLGHIINKLFSRLVFALRKVVLNRVQIHDLKVCLILHTLEHSVV